MPRPCRSLTLAVSAAGLLSAGCPPALVPAKPPARVPPPTLGYQVSAPIASQATTTRFERPPIEPLRSVGCSFATPRWAGTKSTLNLFLRVGAAAWATLPKSASMPVTITVEEGWSAARLHLEQAGVALDAVVFPDEVPLFPQQLVTLDEFAVLLHDHRLFPRDLRAGEVSLVISLGAPFREPGALSSQWRCDQIGLEAQKFQPPLLNAKRQALAVVPAGISLALRDTPRGKVRATLEPSEDLMVDVIARDGDAKRIRWESGEMMFFGWVDGAALSSASALLGWGGLGMRGSGPPKPPPPSFEVTCTQTLPLIVWQRGLARTVGTLGAGARFAPSVMLGELVAVDVKGLDLELSDGSFYTVADEIPKYCTRAPVAR